MVSSLVLTGTYTIGMSGSGKIKVEDNILAIKNIPFIRYRFGNYGDTELEYIKNMKEKFKGPVHLAEVTIGPRAAEELKHLSEINSLARFLYIPVNNSDGDIPQEVYDLLGEIVEVEKGVNQPLYDRIMIKDTNSYLYPLLASQVKMKISKATGFNQFDIGVCGSTFSFKGGTSDVGDCCLTAVKARELLAKYSESDEIMVPTASHESMSCCGCIRYMVVSSDLESPGSTGSRGAGNRVKKEKTDMPSEPKAPKIKGRLKANWF